MSEEKFFEDLKNKVHWFKKINPPFVLLLHHNDSDGLSSGAILSSALERLSIKFHRYALERLYPEVLSYLIQDEYLPKSTLVMITDFGSGMTKKISECNKSKHPVLILDHHTIEECNDPLINLINPLKYGFSGRTDCSASTVCALFANEISPLNKDLFRIATIGFTGDGQKPISLNSKVIERELDLNLINKAVSTTDALGGFGYFKGGSDVGIKGLREGYTDQHFQIAEKFRAEYESIKEVFLKSSSINVEKNLISFDCSEFFYDFGVKTVGLLCEDIKDIYKDKNSYVLGFQKIPDIIPGLKEFSFNQYKVSMRVTEKKLLEIENGRAKSIAEILPKAAREVLGFSDACHPHAGAVTIPISAKNELLNRILT